MSQRTTSAPSYLLLFFLLFLLLLMWLLLGRDILQGTPMHFLLSLRTYFCFCLFISTVPLNPLDTYPRWTLY